MLEAANARVTRLRLGLEGAYSFPSECGRTLTASFGFRVRHDGGDAETGFGADLGASLAYTDPSPGVTADLHGRRLLTHAASAFRELGFSGSLTFGPTPFSDRGLSLSLKQTIGTAAAGGVDALYGRDAMAGLAVSDYAGTAVSPARHGLEVRIGYGLSTFGGRFTATPELGFGRSDSGRHYSLGLHLTREGPNADPFDLRLEATRHEAANDNAPEHGIEMKAELSW